jgi:hypothetical protein
LKGKNTKYRQFKFEINIIDGHFWFRIQGTLNITMQQINAFITTIIIEKIFAYPY